MACDQPIGDSHTSASPRTSPMPRTTNARPKRAIPTPLAARACVKTWARHSPMATKTTPSAATEAP